tara:strand:+ start:541 stop:714 length:174 start_codon:yes stop_codon:yes gene_type:complete
MEKIYRPKIFKKADYEGKPRYDVYYYTSKKRRTDCFECSSFDNLSQAEEWISKRQGQ